MTQTTTAVQALPHVTIERDYAESVATMRHSDTKTAKFWVSASVSETTSTSSATNDSNSTSAPMNKHSVHASATIARGGTALDVSQDTHAVKLHARFASHSQSTSDARLRVEASFDICALDALVVPPELVHVLNPSAKTRNPIGALALSPSATLLVVGGNDGFLRVLSTADLEPTSTTFVGHLGDITTARFFPSSSVLLTSASDLTIKVWDAVSGACPVTMGPKDGGHTRPVTSTGIIDRGRNIITSAKDGRILLWEVKSGSIIRAIHDDSARMVECMSIGTRNGDSAGNSQTKKDEREVSTDDKVCFAGFETGELVGYDLGMQSSILKIMPSFRSSRPNVTACAYDSSNGRVSVGTIDGFMHVYDLRNTSSPLASVRRNDASILNMEFVGSDSENAFGFVFSNEEGSCAQVQFNHENVASVVKEYVGTDVEPLSGMSLVDGVLATGGREGTVRLYNA
ncbi:WD40-repeat-containing domain protein [Chytriomyces cf. hyalinus JEL632]|nr:WD40-repeat-containing domain protein [Chytriomyces cf. hyalinus JEL632]